MQKEHFVKVKKQRRDLDELINVPLIFKTKDGEIFGAYNDGYDIRTVYVYDMHELSEDKKEWVEYYTEQIIDGIPVKDSLPQIFLQNVEWVFRPKDSELSLSDALELWVNPSFKPLKTIKCNWNGSRPHSNECNAQLHEALADIYTTVSCSLTDEIKHKKFSKSFDLVRKWIIQHNGNVP